MSVEPSLFWHDYETTGPDPRRDRPLQFAGIRTDAALNEIGEPRVLYCQPPADVLPSPIACAVTGIEPEWARAHGLIEAEFAAAVLDELGAPGTCGVGFNAVRFDDEVTRHLLWRNLYDPYAREWREGNSRWDVIDMFRLARALRPEGMSWPARDDGAPSFRLEDLAAANGVDYAAHDALADVRATLALVRVLRAAQPRLYDFVFGQRGWQQVLRRLDPSAPEPVLYVSQRIDAHRGAIAPVVPIARHPVKIKSVIVADLARDPTPLIEWAGADLARSLFAPAETRDPDVAAVPLYEIALNRAPVVVPLATLDAAAAERLALDRDRIRANWQCLREQPDLASKVEAVYGDPPTGEHDPDVALYDGLVGDDDRARLDGVHRHAPEELADFEPGFSDPRLHALYFRYRARNWPGTLTAGERRQWRELRWHRLCRGEAGSPRDVAAFRDELQGAVGSGGLATESAMALEAWADELIADLPPCSDG